MNATEEARTGQSGLRGERRSFSTEKRTNDFKCFSFLLHFLLVAFGNSSSFSNLCSLYTRRASPPLFDPPPFPGHGADLRDVDELRRVDLAGLHGQGRRAGRQVGGGGYRGGAEAFDQAGLPSRSEQVFVQDHAA